MKIVAALLSTALIAGCASTYQDPRPADVQQAELETALKELSGLYEVVDARNDSYGHLEFKAHTLAVHRQGNIANFLLLGKDGAINIAGNWCNGRIVAGRNSPRLFCDGEKGGLFAPVVELATKDQEITMNGLFAGKAMPVKAGDYLFSVVSSGSGRSHYYVLKKKRPPVTE